MPLLVRKKLVSADCACAGVIAVAEMAATATHAGKMVRAKLFIEVSLLFLWALSSTHHGKHYSGNCTDQITRDKEKGAAE
jgi:hypothetical protein